MTSEVEKLIQEISERAPETKCMMCQALARLSESDREALYAGYDGGVLNAKQVAEILAKTAGFTGSLRHGSAHFRGEGHQR